MQIKQIKPIHNLTKPLVQLKAINVNFGTQVALENIHLNIYPNSITTIVGPNGGVNLPY